MNIEPQKGKQSEFLESCADIVLYGGAAGGGKTHAILMEAIRNIATKGFGAVIFRKSLTQISKEGALWDTAEKIYPLVGGRGVKGNLIFYWDHFGTKIDFCYLARDADVLDWQGTQIPLICCEIGTKVRTSGKLKNIEDLNISDKVDTLSGSSKITAIGKVRSENCVRLSLEGEIKQVHSDTHQILTNYGWLSYSDIYCFFERTLRRFFHTCDTSSVSTSLFLLPFLLVRTYLIEQGTKHDLPESYRHILLGIYAEMVCKGLESDSLESVDDILNALMQALSHQKFLKLFLLHSPSVEVGRSHTISLIRHVFCDAHSVKQFLNFLSNYHLLSSFYGVCVQLSQDSDRDFVPLLAYVAECSQNSQQKDDLDNNPRHNPVSVSFSHPYNGKEQTSARQCKFHTFDLSFVGERKVVDITVNNENHYITESGLVNKNCFDELTHFSKKQFFYMLSRNRSLCGVKPYVRATCNPDPDSWVREFIDWWIDEDGYAIEERSGVIRWFVNQNDEIHWFDTQEEADKEFPTEGGHSKAKSFTFIKSNIYDNKILMKENPEYLSNLEALPSVDRARLLDGNWNVRVSAGDYFDSNDFLVVDALPKMKHVVRCWDLASTLPNPINEDPDWTVGVKAGIDNNGVITVIDMVRFRENPSGVERKFKNASTKDGGNVDIRIPQDPGSAGKTVAANYVKMMAGYRIKALPVSGSKEVRATPASAQAGIGNMQVLRGAWNKVFFEELEGFPLAAHDDIVDALSDCVEELTNIKKPVRVIRKPVGVR